MVFRYHPHLQTDGGRQMIYLLEGTTFLWNDRPIILDSKSSDICILEEDLGDFVASRPFHMLNIVVLSINKLYWLIFALCLFIVKRFF